MSSLSHCIRWVYPALSIGLVPVHLFVVNWGELRWGEVWPLWLGLAAVATAVQAFLVLVSAPPWTRLGFSLGWLAFFLYASMHRFVGVRHIVLVPALVLVCFPLLWLLIKARDSTVETMEGPFTLGVSTVMLINLVVFFNESVDVPEVDSGVSPIFEHVVPEAGVLPDVYLIVFDGFAGGVALEKTFDYDNTDFVREMEKRGFDYFERSRSVYDFTICSIPAVVSARLICHEVLGRSWNASYSYLKYRSVADSQPLRAMRRAGYKFVAIASDENVSFESLGVDQRTFPRREYLNLLVSHSPFAFLKSARLALGSRNAQGRKWHPASILWALDEVESEAASGASPKFVFAHIMLPHMPFYFDADGRVQRRYLEEPWVLDHQPMEKLKRAYLDQVAFLEKRMMRLADRIKPGANGLSPIVLFQGDHGPRWPERGETEYTGYESRSEAWAISQFSALNMVRAPREVTARLNTMSSPSNSFIAVVNSIFSSNIEPMPDKSYAMIDENRGGRVCIGEVTRSFAQESGPLRELCESP